MQDIMQGRGSVKVSSGAVDGLCVGMLLAGGLRQIRGCFLVFAVVVAIWGPRFSQR